MFEDEGLGERVGPDVDWDSPAGEGEVEDSKAELGG